MRVYEYARSRGLESNDILELAEQLGIPAKTASSGLKPEDVELLNKKLDHPAPTKVIETEELPTEEPPPSPEEPLDLEPEIGIVTVQAGVSVAQFADLIGQHPDAVLTSLKKLGTELADYQLMPTEQMEKVGEQFGVMVELFEPEKTPTREKPVYEDKPEHLFTRPPVVTVMGHVDHGKTTLLDYIRRTNVVGDEQGGITQHIGAYQVEVGEHTLTFIDTPGHAAFTALRARGAEITDIVVLVVAADDGVMPQTVEAISHTKAAGNPMVVALNKMDSEGADPLRVRTQLTEHGVIVEELGGEVPSVELSALTGEGVEHLLEVIDLVAQLEDLQANPAATASGVVIEAHRDPGLGPVATVIVERGTLKPSQAVVAGTVSARVRSMLEDSGQRVKQATPAQPVLITGWSEVPTAGDHFEVVKNDRTARRIASDRANQLRSSSQRTPTAAERLQMLLDQLQTEDAELALVVKADAHGSLEAIQDSIKKITRTGGKITVAHAAVGGINENDVNLAEVTNGVVIGFNVRPDPNSRRLAEDKGIELRTFGIIYELLDEIEQMLVGRLAPDQEEIVTGTAEVRATFKTPRAGTVAGCYISEGSVTRGSLARLIRNGLVVYEGRVDSLRRFKDDVTNVSSGFECGIGLENYNDVKEGDTIELYEIREVART